MLNECLTSTYWYLHGYSLYNWSFTNAKLVLTDSSNQINIYYYLTVTYQYLVCAYIVKAALPDYQFWPIFKQYLQTCEPNLFLLRQFIIQIKWFCHFPWRYNFLSQIKVWIEWHIDGCPFRFVFNSAKVLAYSNEK